MFDLSGKVALVTGSSQGIGYAVAECLTGQGAKVFVHGSNEEKCKKAAAEIGAVPVTVDLSDPGAAEKLYAKTGDVDILILNASVQFKKPWDKITGEEFDKQVAVNFKCSLEAMQVYSEAMKKKGFGRIITVGSVQQYKPHSEMAVYAATKCAQMSLVKNIAKQLAPYGVTVNNISPGVIATPRNEAALADPVYSKKVLDSIPLGYAGEAMDIAGAALLLCSDEGRYITGADIVIDGGMSL